MRLLLKDSTYVSHGSTTPSFMTLGIELSVTYGQHGSTYYCICRSRPRKISSPTGSKDLQMVNITLRVLSRPDAQALPDVYKYCSKIFSTHRCT